MSWLLSKLINVWCAKVTDKNFDIVYRVRIFRYVLKHPQIGRAGAGEAAPTPTPT